MDIVRKMFGGRFFVPAAEQNKSQSEQILAFYWDRVEDGFVMSPGLELEAKHEIRAASSD
jgi:hypothetical protein